VKSFKGRVKRYEIWNEWDSGCGMSRWGKGRLDDYFRLIKFVYPRLKKIDPEARILVGAVTSGGVRKCFDHPNRTEI